MAASKMKFPKRHLFWALLGVCFVSLIAIALLPCESHVQEPKASPAAQKTTFTKNAQLEAEQSSLADTILSLPEDKSDHSDDSKSFEIPQDSLVEIPQDSLVDSSCSLDLPYPLDPPQSHLSQKHSKSCKNTNSTNSSPLKRSNDSPANVSAKKSNNSKHPKTPPSNSSFKGIKNMGNTCFLASLIQCLRHCSELLQVLPNPKTNLVTQIINDPKMQISPQVYDAFREISPVLVDGTQQDSSELLMILFDYWFPFPPEKGGKPNPFTFNLESTLLKGCGHQSVTSNQENILMLGFVSSHRKNANSFSRMLNEFQKMENLRKDDILDCDICGRRMQAQNKKLTITKSGELLVVMYKRFIHATQHRPAYKIGLPVRIRPIEEINGVSYELFGWIEHLGITQSSGHYVAYAKTDKWRRFDDSAVTELTEFPSADNAYCVFLRRI